MKIIKMIKQRLDILEGKFSSNADSLSTFINKTQNITGSLQHNQNLITNEISLVSLIADNNKLLLEKPTPQYIVSCNEPSTSGVYNLIDPDKIVYCEMNSFNGNLLVIQQRVDFELSFNRNWAQYRDGFGTVGKDSDFWLGLEAVHQITKGGEYELFVQIEDGFRTYGYAQYSHFYVAGEHDKYRLTVRNYEGTIGDWLEEHNNMKFSTYDDDNDVDEYNCAQKYGSGWWFSDCYFSNLNGLLRTGIRWGSRSRHATYTRMMIRRK